MTLNDQLRNRALLHFMVLPLVLLTVTLLGGLRISADTHGFLFIAPPLITLVLALLLVALAARGGLINLGVWLSTDQSSLALIGNSLTLLALFFASAQAFNSVMPEQGLLHWLFSFFFLWTLWNNQFAAFDAARTVRSLAVLFGTAFLLKHVVFSSFYASDGSWMKQLTTSLVQGVLLGSPYTSAYAPATGYISFFTTALFVGGLALIEPAPSQAGRPETLSLEASHTVDALQPDLDPLEVTLDRGIKTRPQ
jgi:hypothetical protein